MKRSARQFLAVAFVFVGFGLILLPWLLWADARANQMKTWPEARATVLSTGIHSYKARYQPLVYLHDIAYQYAVAGVTYNGDRVSYGGIGPNWSYENGARDTLPKIGNSILVKYDPESPDYSVIHVVTGQTFNPPVLKPVLIALSVALGVLTLISGLQWKRERADERSRTRRYRQPR
jgi:hypothetical protein